MLRLSTLLQAVLLVVAAAVSGVHGLGLQDPAASELQQGLHEDSPAIEDPVSLGNELQDDLAGAARDLQGFKYKKIYKPYIKPYKPYKKPYKPYKKPYKPYKPPVYKKPYKPYKPPVYKKKPYKKPYYKKPYKSGGVAIASASANANAVAVGGGVAVANANANAVAVA